MDTKVIIDNKPVEISDTKTVFSFKAPAPQWTSTMFNVVLVVAGLATTAVVSFFNNYLNTETQLLIVTICAYVTYAVRFIGKSFGLEIKD